MITALSALYPPERSAAGRIFRPVIDPRYYLRALYLLLIFPRGVAYFVFFVTAFAFGGALAWTFVGFGVLFLAMYISLRLGDLEALLVGAVSGTPVRRPPQRLEGVTSLRQKVWARVIDPTTWTGLLYLLLQFPIGIAAMVTMVATFSVAGSLLGAPLIVLATDEQINLGPFTPDTPAEALALVPLGAVAWVVALHVAGVASTLHTGWARLMLGSRARRRPPADPPATRTLEPPPFNPPTATEAPPSEALPEAAEARAHAPPAAPDDYPELAELTLREREVLLLLARGLSNAEIAEVCFISEGTVKTHVKRILSKLDLHDRTQVVVFAYEYGLVEPGMRPAGLRARSDPVSSRLG